MAASKILVADDDQAVVQLLAILLKKAGYEVIVAMDGFQAVEFAHKHHPDLLILDVNMPAGSGLSVQERIQKIAALCTARIIYLTGDKSDRVIADAGKLGAYKILYKPLDRTQLLQAVAGALDESADEGPAASPPPSAAKTGGMLVG